MRPSVVGLFVFVLSGCTITAINEQQEQDASNSCSSDDECDNRHCLEGICQATAGQVESLLIEVTPPSDSRLAHIPLITSVDKVPTSGGELDLSLTRAARVTGSMSIPLGSGCEMTHFYFPSGTQAPGSSPSSDGLSIPVTVTLTPRTALLGLPSQTYQVQADKLTFEDVSGRYVFDVQVPAGDYDVYVVPPVRQEGCQVPPQLYRRQAILTDTNLQFTVAPTQKPLSLAIAFPSSSDALKGWVVDIIERVSGNRLSTEQVLDAPDASGNYFAKLAYSTVNDRKVPADPVEVETDLLRLRPPPGLVAPTIYADRAGLGLFGSGDNADLGAFTKYPTPVEVEGQLTALDDGVPVGGHVSFVSTEIYGVDDGVFAAYQTAIDVPDTGLFSLELPPGKYRVYAVPPLLSPDEPGLSALELSWDIPDDVPLQAGKLIELPRIANVVGSASLQGAQVYVIPSPQSVLPFAQVFGAAAFVPRATADMVDDRGSFRIEADPGRFDVSVRSSDASGFGWFVRPGFEVEPGGHEQALGRLALPEPSAVTGIVRVTLGGDAEPALLPSALIRAYAFLDKDLKYTRDQAQARSVIQVAETRSDSQGNYRLLVPAGIDAAK